MRFVVNLPGYAFFVFALLKIFVFPVTEYGRYGGHPLVGMTALQAVALVALGAAWLHWAVPPLSNSLSLFFSRFAAFFSRRLAIPNPPNSPIMIPMSLVFLLAILFTGSGLLYLFHPSKQLPSQGPAPTVVVNFKPLSAIPPSFRIRFPQYADLSDQQLTEKILQKYPEVRLPGGGINWDALSAPTLAEVRNSDAFSSAASAIDIYVHIGGQTFQQLPPSAQDNLCAAGREIRAAMQAYHNTLADLGHMERAIYDITALSGRCK